MLEKNRIANTIEDFPEGKWVYAEPDSKPALGKLWLDGSRKEDLIQRWHQIVREADLDIHTEEALKKLEGAEDRFQVTTDRSSYRARRVVLATGQRGTPRRLDVPGEEREQVYHRLYSPKHYKDEDILVVGGGNSAVEAALVLSENNRVTLSYRSDVFSRLFKDNRQQLDGAMSEGRIEAVLNSNIQRFNAEEYELQIEEEGGSRTERKPYDHAFVLIGAEPPEDFLRSLGIRMENDWTGNLWLPALFGLLFLAGLWLFGGNTGVAALTGLGAAGVGLSVASGAGLLYTGWKGNRFSWLMSSFLICYTIYGAKLGDGQEFWPYKGWGYKTLSFFGRPWSFWYTVLYSLLMTFFGLQAIRRWGFDRKDKFQIWRYVSLLSFQWIFFFLIPEFLFQWAVRYQWVGEELANDSSFTNQAWRSYGIVYAWPLFFYTFFGSPHQIWIVWGLILTFGIIPVLVLFHGKRYCSWICGCGGLAETLGDRWRWSGPQKWDNQLRLKIHRTEN